MYLLRQYKYDSLDRVSTMQKLFRMVNGMRKIDGDYNVELINYSYIGNQLAGCTYDNNGNLTYDPSLGLTFEWNRLNLLQKVSRGDKILVIYSYLADNLFFGIQKERRLRHKKNNQNTIAKPKPSAWPPTLTVRSGFLFSLV